VLLAAAILSILLNPLLFKLLDRAKARLDARAAQGEAPVGAVETAPLHPTALSGHVVIAGYGRLGQLLGEAAHATGHPLLVLEEEKDHVDALRQQGIETIVGNASSDEVLEAANLPGAKALLVTLPQAFESGEVIRAARKLNPGLRIIARADSEECRDHLQKQGADLVVMGERELARAMTEGLAPA
jgi:CPA2 family monovalent cation:H+ antiporter-2